MYSIKRQLSAFGILLFLVISPVTSVSGQKRILNSPVSKTADFNTDVLLPETRIATERTVYDTGQNVVSSGSGFNKYEQVTFNVERIDAFRKTNDLLAAWIVFAD